MNEVFFLVPASQRRQNALNFKLCVWYTPLVSLTRLWSEKKKKRHILFLFKRTNVERTKKSKRREDCSWIKGLVHDEMMMKKENNKKINIFASLLLLFFSSKKERKFRSNEKREHWRVRMHRSTYLIFQGFFKRKFFNLSRRGRCGATDVCASDALQCKNHLHTKNFFTLSPKKPRQNNIFFGWFFEDVCAFVVSDIGRFFSRFT